MKKYAFLFATTSCPHYVDDEGNKLLSDLTSPENDLNDLGDALRVERLGFSNVEANLNKESRDVWGSLAKMLKGVEEDDLVLVYYSGHGLLKNQKLHLATLDSDPTVPTTSIEFSNLLSCLREARVSRGIIILDCCYAGAAANDMPEVKGGLNEFADAEDRAAAALEIARAAEEVKGMGRGIYVLAACAPWQVALGEKNEGENKGYGHFSRHLITGFGGVASSGRNPPSGAVGEVTVASLFRHIVRELHNENKTQVPRLCVYDASGEPDMRITIIENLEGIFDPKSFTIWNELSLLENLVPTYILDSGFRFLHWNAAFQDIVAAPLKLRRGQHVQTFAEQLDNWESEVRLTSLRDFPSDIPALNYPPVHVEHLKLRTEKYGYIDFVKMASRIRDSEGLWCVSLNIAYAQRGDEMWKSITSSMLRDDIWTKYAEAYDAIIAGFSKNEALVSSVTNLVGNSKRCLDLGAGTGNSTLKLLEAPSRKVTAVDMNYYMLKRLHEKISANPNHEKRTTIMHCDAVTALRRPLPPESDSSKKKRDDAFKDATFDACVMTNVLFAVDDPLSLFHSIFRVLKPGGVLALSTSHEKTNIEPLFQDLKAELLSRSNSNALPEDTERLFHLALKSNQEMNPIIQRYSEKQVMDWLTEAGFNAKVVDHVAYCGCVFVVKAEKPADPAGKRSVSKAQQIPASDAAQNSSNVVEK